METRVIGYQSHGSVGVVQLATSDRNTFEYISSGEAIKNGLVTVTEVGEAGSVNTLGVRNNSKSFIFFMDGDILAGAKQNRVLNTSLLLAPESITKIPVSCVEQGRWRRVSDAFYSTDHVAPSILRAMKAKKVAMSLRKSRQFDADQAEVWQNVNVFESASGIDSRTSNLSDVYEGMKAGIDAFVEHCKPLEGANGVGIFIGSDLVNIDLFNRGEVFTEYLP